MEAQPTELDLNKYHVMTPKKKRAVLLLAFIIIFVILPITAFIYYDFAINRPAQAGKNVSFVINEGDNVSVIASNLYSEDLVNSAFLFKFYVVANNLSNLLQAGVYNIPAGASVVELADQFQHGTNDFAITFIEGWRVEEFALHANKNFDKIDFERFVVLAKDSEGYLFPDTYYFNSEVDEAELLNRLTTTFREKTSDILTVENLARADMTEAEVLTFASIVEREVSNPDDRYIVAGILITRWRNGELLGADATTQYAVANNRLCDVDVTTSEACIPTKEDASNITWWPNTLTLDDLALDTPYNTRLNVGLPPTPIANPGLSAIEAVLNYTESDYSYYLTDEEGLTHYARTLEEHNQNVADYL